jgi:hypothetical protein
LAAAVGLVLVLGAAGAVGQHLAAAKSAGIGIVNFSFNRRS